MLFGSPRKYLKTSSYRDQAETPGPYECLSAFTRFRATRSSDTSSEHCWASGDPNPGPPRAEPLGSRAFFSTKKRGRSPERSKTPVKTKPQQKSPKQAIRKERNTQNPTKTCRKRLQLFPIQYSIIRRHSLCHPTIS